MSRDDFIIWVSCLVCTYDEEVIKNHPVRRGGGFTPKLTAAYVITIEMGGESFQPHTDKARFRYFRSHYPHFFPCLTDRTCEAGRQPVADFRTDPTTNR